LFEAVRFFISSVEIQSKGGSGVMRELESRWKNLRTQNVRLLFDRESL